MPIGVVQSLDHEGRGVIRQEGVATVVAGALPGETVAYASFRRKPKHELAHLVSVLAGSPVRMQPRCEHFGVCGGCALQHLDLAAQVAVKQRMLEDSIRDVGGVRPEQMLPPIQGEAWGYRHRARLAVGRLPSKGGVLIGFHERRSSYIADMRSCAVLPPHVSALLLPMRELFGALSIAERIPQVDLAVGDACTMLVLRILAPLSFWDEDLLREFADRHNVVFYLQTKGPATAYRFHPVPGPRLSYSLPEFDLQLEFGPTDFTQVNHGVNRVLVRRALRWLEAKPGERIGDMFCGLGNFTLPIARCGANVVGIDGSDRLVQRGRENAEANGLAARATFGVANLFECTSGSLAALGHFDKMLIDPPREGAIELVNALGENGPGRIVYVSCNPATLARDAAVLVSVKAYRFVAAGVVNMFPHTAHVESIAVFERP